MVKGERSQMSGSTEKGERSQKSGSTEKRKKKRTMRVPHINIELAEEEEKPKPQIQYYRQDTVEATVLDEKQTGLGDDLMVAVEEGNLVRVKYVIGQGLRVPDNPRSYIALHTASLEGYTPIVDLLTRTGLNANRRDNNGETPLHKATFNGHTACAEILISRGGLVNNQTALGDTALGLAAGRGFAGTVRLLLENRAKPDLVNANGESPLILAASGGHVATIRMLFMISWRVMLHKRAMQQEAEEKNSLLSLQPEPSLEVLPEGDQSIFDCMSAKDNTGATALHVAAEKGHSAAVQALLNLGAEVDETDNYGCSALHKAVAYGQPKHIRTLRVLLNYNPDVNLQDKSGWSALHKAVFWGRKEALRFLLRHGANPRLGNFEHITPMELARQRGKLSLMLILQRYCEQTDPPVNFPVMNPCTCIRTSYQDLLAPSPRVGEGYGTARSVSSRGSYYSRSSLHSARSSHESVTDSSGRTSQSYFTGLSLEVASMTTAPAPQPRLHLPPLTPSSRLLTPAQPDVAVRIL